MSKLEILIQKYTLELEVLKGDLEFELNKEQQSNTQFINTVDNILENVIKTESKLMYLIGLVQSQKEE